MTDGSEFLSTIVVTTIFILHAPYNAGLFSDSIKEDGKNPRAARAFRPLGETVSLHRTILQRYHRFAQLLTAATAAKYNRDRDVIDESQ
jgi:hypothetical protein